jgi:hypothetical protein
MTVYVVMNLDHHILGIYSTFLGATNCWKKSVSDEGNYIFEEASKEGFDIKKSNFSAKEVVCGYIEIHEVKHEILLNQ